MNTCSPGALRHVLQPERIRSVEALGFGQIVEPTLCGPRTKSEPMCCSAYASLRSHDERCSRAEIGAQQRLGSVQAVYSSHVGEKPRGRGLTMRGWFAGSGLPQSSVAPLALDESAEETPLSIDEDAGLCKTHTTASSSTNPPEMLPMTFTTHAWDRRRLPSSNAVAESDIGATVLSLAGVWVLHVPSNS